MTKIREIKEGFFLHLAASLLIVMLQMPCILVRLSFFFVVVLNMEILNKTLQLASLEITEGLLAHETVNVPALLH